MPRCRARAWARAPRLPQSPAEQQRDDQPRRRPPRRSRSWRCASRRSAAGRAARSHTPAGAAAASAPRPSARIARLKEVAASGSISSSASVPTSTKGRFGMSRTMSPDVEAHVQPGVAQHVQQAVEEGIQPEHATQPGQCRPARPLTQRRDGQRQAQEAQHPVAGAASQRLGRVRPQGVGQRAVQQPQEWAPAPAGRTAAWRRGARAAHSWRAQGMADAATGDQKNLLRSIPA